MSRIIFLLAALAMSACVPQAIYFHETTKVAFAADYNTSDSQPVSTSFGFKRRIVAVVPAKERVSADGSDRHATNAGEALSLVSKFHVRAGSFQEGVIITNNFASGTAARVMTGSTGSAPVVSALMHNAPIEVSPTTNKTREGVPAAEAANARIRSALHLRDTSGDPDTALTGDPKTRKPKLEKIGKRETPPGKPKPEEKVHGPDVNEDPDTELVRDPVTGKFELRKRPKP